jgi:DNA-binding beta-propeller fold protein YncE
MRIALGLLLAIAALAFPAGVGATTGTLSQLSGRAGCVEVRSNHDGCAGARFGGNQRWAIALSPDGRNAYVASLGGALSVFRVGRDGSLSQLRGPAGCLSRSGKLGCARVRTLTQSRTLAVSADGRSVYVGIARGVLAFSRDRRSGRLKALAVYLGRGLFAGAETLVVSSDGRSVYAASQQGRPSLGAVAVFSRSRSTGRLVQLAGNAGCLDADGSGGCGSARGLYGECCGLAISPDASAVYASSTQFLPLGSASPTSAKLGVATFSRDPVSGGLTQLPDAAGCVTQDGADGCAAVTFASNDGENLAGGLVVSPDERFLYLAHVFTAPEAEAGCSDNFVAVFPRDSLSGALGTLGQELPACGRQLAASPDGQTLYTSDDFSHVVLAFGRRSESAPWKRVSCLGELQHCGGLPRGIEFPEQLAISPSGRNAYLVGNSGVAVLRRSR